MRRSGLVLFVLALAGWLGAIASQAVAMRADDEKRTSRWTVTRNQFLLLSSISMNTLVLSVIYRFVRRLLRGGGR